MPTIYPTGQHAESLIKYHIERIQAMERELANVKQENELLHSIIKQQTPKEAQLVKPLQTKWKTYTYCQQTNQVGCIYIQTMNYS